VERCRLALVANIFESAPKETLAPTWRVSRWTMRWSWIDETWGSSFDPWRWGDAHQGDRTTTRPWATVPVLRIFHENIRQSPQGATTRCCVAHTGARGPDPFRQRAHGAGFRRRPMTSPTGFIGYLVTSTGQSGQLPVHPLRPIWQNSYGGAANTSHVALNKISPRAPPLASPS